MTIEIPTKPEWLKVGVKSNDVGVDRENKVIRGMVMAQEGTFLESDPRGRFNAKSIKKLVSMGRKNSQGLKSRFTHPSLSSDGLGSFLGRVKNIRQDTVTVKRDGEITPLLAMRGDLHLAEAAFSSPRGNLGDYVLDLAEEDSDALSSSLVLQPQEIEELDSDGKPLLDEATGEPLPPLWMPISLHASDIVDEGAAVDGLLSAVGAGELRDDVVRQGFALLSGFLPGQPREVVEARLQSWMDKALSMRFGDEEPTCKHCGELAADCDNTCRGVSVDLFERRLALRERVGA